MAESMPLLFKEFLREYFPEYVIDKQSEPIVDKLGLWAYRDEKFNAPEMGHYLDKGILLTGGVGTGKTEIMRLLRKYLTYLRSPYRFNMEIVWNFAPAYRIEGPAVFGKIKRGNWYFDELALTNADGIPYMEMVNDFGNKIFIGETLIMIRYNEFKKFALQTSFSTNMTYKQLEQIYGKRSFSRLFEMCNFIDYTGKDRRINSNAKPTFHTNDNNYTPADANVPSESVNIDLKEGYNSMYMQYRATGSFDHIPQSQLVSAFEIFRSFGVECANDQELNEIKLEVETQRIQDIKIKSATPINREERNRMKALIDQYDTKKLDAEEKAYLWGQTKIIAVKRYFTKCKDLGADKIFPV